MLRFPEFRRTRLWLRLGLVLAAGGLVTAGCAGPAASAGDSGGGLTLRQVASGLLLADAFDRPAARSTLRRRFAFGGSAPRSRTRVRVDGNGLEVAVTGAPADVFSGFYAVTRAAFPASAVFHVRMSRPARNVVSSQCTGEAVFAVQTATTARTGNIDYVLVASVTRAGRTHWEVGYAEGHLAAADTTILWSTPPSADAPHSQVVTVRTDGRSRLEAYFGDRLVFASDQLRMRVAAPFQVYLETQALGLSYAARFRDLWVTAGDTLRIRGLRPGTAVALAPAGHPEIRALADRDGEARLVLPAPQARATGTLTVSGAGSPRRSAAVSYAGGDVYVVP